VDDQLDRLTAALADRYVIERFLNEIKVTANRKSPSRGGAERSGSGSETP